MKTMHWIIAAVALSSVQAVPASAGINDPEVIIYRVPGVRDNGGGIGVGVATVFVCTNFSGAEEILRIVVRNANGAILQNSGGNIFHLATNTKSTHPTNLFSLSAFLNTGAVNQGTAAIAATSLSIICTAMIVDAAATSPQGIALRMIRFNPVPGSQE